MGGSSLAELAARVEALFARADGETEAFRKRSGLACPPGCGACCESEEVTATPLEFLPLALELLRRGEAALWLERLGAEPPPARCLFYHRDPARPGHGRCTVHRWRPLLCRLFGFAGVPDRTGRPRLAACKLQHLALPGLVARAETLACPSFRSFSMEASALDGPLGTRLLPVHEALFCCPHCGGRRRLVSFITEPEVIERILTHLGIVPWPKPPPLPERAG